ncbi:hypothetical protein ACIPSA_46855 [Streptomyces sp. NPDC086549]
MTQQGVVAAPLAKARLLAAQFSASAANHVLPARLGVSTVDWRS